MKNAIDITGFNKRLWYFGIYLLIFVLPGLQRLAIAQGSVSGKILDADTNSPLVGAHVFIGATMIGTVSDTNGAYLLDDIPKGTHKLRASMIGYEMATEQVAIVDTLHHEVQLSLQPAILQIGELEVTARRDRRWKKRLNRFKKLFIGETSYAAYTTLNNPEVLDFNAKWWGKFSAEAMAPLEIENHALGYSVQYFLKDFIQEGDRLRYDGDPLFEPMRAEDASQDSLWKKNREIAFNGSFRHFILALLQGVLEEEGFEVFRIPSSDDMHRADRRFRVDPEELVRFDDETGAPYLDFHGILEIIYYDELEEKGYLEWAHRSHHSRLSNQVSWIRLTNGPAEIDTTGEMVDPYGVTVSGYYAYERVAHELPKEYRAGRFAAK